VVWSVGPVLAVAVMVVARLAANVPTPPDDGGRAACQPWREGWHHLGL